MLGLSKLPSVSILTSFLTEKFQPCNQQDGTDLTRAIGCVPIVRLRRLTQVCSERMLYLKLESLNPGGSIKDKNAVHLIEEAERRGVLQPGGTIVESSSGNFGVSLAMIGATRSYRVIIVIDQKTTRTFRRTLQAYGAELVEVPLEEADASGSMQRARMRRAREIADSLPGAWYPCQHENPLNPEAHAQVTGAEIEAAFPDGLGALVVGVSTGGQITGLARRLKPRFPDLEIIAVDVQGSQILGTPPAPYKMTGIGMAFRPAMLDYSLIDAGYVVSESLAYSVCHALARREGLLLGASTGAIVAAGLAHALKNPGKKLLMINPDRGERYLETIYDPAWLAAHGFELIPGEALEQRFRELEPIDMSRARGNE